MSKPSDNPHGRRTSGAPANQAASGHQAAPAAEGGGNKKIVVLAAVFSVLLIAIGAGAFFAGKSASGGGASAENKGADEHAKKQIVYYILDPGFGADIKDETGEAHALQLTIAFVLNEEKAESSIKAREPSIRDKLIEIISSKSYAELLSASGKEKMRADFLATTQKVMEGSSAAHAVTGILFTDYVME